MSKLLELKQALKLHHVVKINPTKFKVSVFNFAHGNCNDYDFEAHYVYKIPYGSYAHEKDYANHIVMVCGLITFPTGKTYKDRQKLTYTDDSEVEKIMAAASKGTDLGNTENAWDEIRKY